MIVPDVGGWKAWASEEGGVVGGGVEAADDTEDEDDEGAPSTRKCEIKWKGSIDWHILVGSAMITPANSRTLCANSAAGSMEDSEPEPDETLSLRGNVLISDDDREDGLADDWNVNGKSYS